MKVTITTSASTSPENKHDPKWNKNKNKEQRFMDVKPPSGPITHKM